MQIINTLRRGFAEDEADKDGPPFHIQIPPEQYFLTPDLDLECQLYGGRRSGSGTSGTFSTSQSESSFGESTVTTSLPTSSRKYLPPEVVEEKKRSRRRRTAAYICLGVLAIALVALAVGVILHFLLETGSIGGGEHIPSPQRAIGPASM